VTQARRRWDLQAMDQRLLWKHLLRQLTIADRSARGGLKSEELAALDAAISAARELFVRGQQLRLVD
jgi:hypothetical protein